MRARRDVEQFSLSFLDVICCGFGAIILLLMITKTVQPQVVEASTAHLEGRIATLQEQLFKLRGESRLLNRDLNARHEQLSQNEELVARLQGQLASVKSHYDTINVQTRASDTTAGNLAIARQRLSAEMKRLQNRQVRKDNNLIGGIPVDSEYIIFVIDTSGSMHVSWNRMLREIQATLDIHPEVKGIQVMNDMGKYMFSRYRGKWIPDSPSRRRLILNNLRTWKVFSNSSPVEGITEAVSTFYAPDKKISVYVFGDDFQGTSIQTVVSAIDKINRAGMDGGRRVRIHAVGFPVQFIQKSFTQSSGVRFAALMRELTHRNGGTFVGLEDYK